MIVMLVIFQQEARRSIFSTMDVITSIRFGEMIFYLAVFILDTGKCYLNPYLLCIIQDKMYFYEGT